MGIFWPFLNDYLQAQGTFFQPKIRSEQYSWVWLANTILEKRLRCAEIHFKFLICITLFQIEFFYKNRSMLWPKLKPSLPPFEFNKPVRTLKEITGVLSSYILVLICYKNEQQSLVFGMWRIAKKKRFWKKIISPWW